jgi:hypothetical protein
MVLGIVAMAFTRLTEMTCISEAVTGEAAGKIKSVASKV